MSKEESIFRNMMEMETDQCHISCIRQAETVVHNTTGTETVSRNISEPDLSFALVQRNLVSLAEHQHADLTLTLSRP